MKKKSGSFIYLMILVLFWGCAFAGHEMKPADNPKPDNKVSEKQGAISLYPIQFYRDYISSVDGDRCAMYPTCSQYCMEAIKKHGSLLGWIMCSDRLMRDGGDETKLSTPVWINGKRRSYDPVKNNDFWWH